MKQWLFTFAPIVPILASLPGCGLSVRSGPRVTVQRGDPSVQGEVSLAGGLSDRHPPTLVAVPLTLAAGARTNDGTAVVHFDSGLEWSEFGANGNWGYRASGRIGGALAGPSGAYVGMRAGPAFAPFGFGFPIFTLEGLVHVGTGGETAGKPMLGGVLSVGLDDYGSLRVPSGRPLRGENGEVLAPQVVWGEPAPRPRWCADLDADEARTLGVAWLEDARMEHASIAAFHRLAAELLSLGAPAPLVAACRRSARDEARHAVDAFRLASGYLGQAVSAGATPEITPRADVSFSVLAREAFLEGVIGEGVAAAVLAARARAATHAKVRGVLWRTARDEARHAALAFAILDFCLRASCGSGARAALERIAPPEFEGDAGRLARPVIASATRRLERRLAATDRGREWLTSPAVAGCVPRSFSPGRACSGATSSPT